MAVGWLAGFAALAAGCATSVRRRANADGTYCFSIGKSNRRTHVCTTTPIPDESVEAEAKRFEPTPDILTVYVVRRRWADTSNKVLLRIEGLSPVETVPSTFVRIRLRPGTHTLQATWAEGKTDLQISGRGNETLFVELVGSYWVWGGTYALVKSDPQDSQRRAMRLPLVADVR